MTPVKLRSCAASLLLLFLGPPAWADLPSARETLEDVGFSDADLTRVEAGEFVSVQPAPSNPSEIATRFAFLVEIPPEELQAEVDRGLLHWGDPSLLGYGVLEGKSSLAAFAKLKLSSSELDAYADPEPGDGINLSTEEIATLRKSGPESAESLKRLLLERYRAYIEKGLDGIQPYARKHGRETSAGEDLRKATEAAKFLDRHAPSFLKAILQYPADQAEDLEERFSWDHYDAHGQPTLSLTHHVAWVDGDAVLRLQRQYYASRGYNSEQAIGVLLPVKQGTIVLYESRISTDQVEGVGSSTKRAIGSRMMRSQLEDLFRKQRGEAVQEAR